MEVSRLQKACGLCKSNFKKGVIKAALALKGYDGRENLEKIQVPVMLLHGKKTITSPPINLTIYYGKNSHKLSIFCGRSGAFSPNEQPEEVGKYLGEFLDLIKEDWE